MSARRMASRVLAVLGAVLIAPLLVLYGLWLAGGRLADLIEQRRARRGRR